MIKSSYHIRSKKDNIKEYLLGLALDQDYLFFVGRKSNMSKVKTRAKREIRENHRSFE